MFSLFIVIAILFKMTYSYYVLTFLGKPQKKVLLLMAGPAIKRRRDSEGPCPPGLLYLWPLCLVHQLKAHVTPVSTFDLYV